MRTKMNLNIVSETEEERKIEEYLTVLHNSLEIQEFLEMMRKEAQKNNVFKFRARIKDIKSAIRTHRINKRNLEEVRDYLGISFITNSEEEIYPIIDFLKEKLPNGDFVDLVSEEMIYSPLAYMKWVPPLGYNVFSKEPIIPNKLNVPIEVRVSSKEAYISEQSPYYAIHKNDTINMPSEQKTKLRKLVQHITYKLALLNVRKLNDEERKKHTKELLELLQNNKEFLRENEKLCRDAILDFGVLVYRVIKDKEILIEEETLSRETIDKIDNQLKHLFNNFINESEGDMISTIQSAVNKLKLIEYNNLKQM